MDELCKQPKSVGLPKKSMLNWKISANRQRSAKKLEDYIQKPTVRFRRKTKKFKISRDHHVHYRSRLLLKTRICSTVYVVLYISRKIIIPTLPANKENSY
jgi:hypothetical protein